MKRDHHKASWKNTTLPRLGETVAHDLLRMMSCFLHDRQWTPSVGTDPAVFSGYAQEHGIGGVIGTLDNRGLLSAPPTIQKGGTEQYIANMIRHEQFSRLLRHVDRIAKKKTIRYAVFKGPALADHIYQDSGVRSYGDIDLLITGRTDLGTLLDDPFFSNNRPDISYSATSFTHPGRTHVIVNGLTLEFFFPITGICDPMFYFVQKHQEQLLRPSRQDEYATPSHTLHFLFLLFHLQKHFCTRLIWHLDILLFFKKFYTVLDIQWIQEELKQMQLCQFSHYLNQFYKRYFDLDLGLFPHRIKQGWNTTIIRHMASIKQVHGTIGANRLKEYPFTTSAITISRLLIITDPEQQSFFRTSRGFEWTAALFCRKFYITNPIILFLASKLMVPIKIALAPLIRHLVLRRFRLQ